MLHENASNDKLSYFRDISTYGGCLAAPAAAIANMKIIEDENLIENCARLGDVFFAGLQKLKAKYPIIGDVRGKGLLLGIELIRDHRTKEPEDESVAIKIFIACKQAGLLIGRTQANHHVYSLPHDFCKKLNTIFLAVKTLGFIGIKKP